MDVIPFMKIVQNLTYNTLRISTNDRVIFLIKKFKMSDLFESNIYVMSDLLEFFGRSQ